MLFQFMQFAFNLFWLTDFFDLVELVNNILVGCRCYEWYNKLFISKIEDFDADAIKAGIEPLANKLGESIIVLANNKIVIAKVSESFVKRGVNAGKIVGEIARATGANGGGRPNFAQGGIKDSSKLEEVLAKIESEVKE